jgi:transcriptional regulator GlxA family with amidase domain
MHRVVVLALPGVMPFELGIAARIFGTAARADGTPLYDVRTCSLDGRTVRSAADFSIVVEHGTEALEDADTVIVPAHEATGPTYEAGTLQEPVAAALRRIPVGARIVSICTAAYVLAAAGVLDDRPATTHWRRAEHFQRLFPRVRVDPRVLFVDDGDVLTSAGVAAGVDLCLHIVRRDHGSDTANQVARNCIVSPWRDGGQAQYIEHPVPEYPATTTAPTRGWALERLGRPLPLSALAAHANVSVRTFTRRFRAEVGISPNEWLVQQRLDLARRLLETTELSVDAIAAQAGLGSTGSLRKHLHAAMGLSPSAYRRSFHGPPRAAGAVMAAPAA